MIKNFICFFIEGFIICLLLCVPILAENFYIENYNVNIKVNNLKQVSITENIDVYFTYNSHGIYRKIPHDKATITNIRISEKNVINEDIKCTNIKIGDPNIFVQGKHSYTISYDYNYFDNKNEFYHNIIGTDWDTEIRHVKFVITMPKEFNPSDVGLSIGGYGVKDFDGGAIFNVVGLNILGEVNRILKPKEGVTIRVQVPDGYFNKASNTRMYICIVLLCFITFISFMIWYKFGKDDKAIPVVNFYPPKDMNILETEIVYKEKATTQGLVAMLFCLAQKGYIKIYEENGSYTLEKIKDYEGDDKLERSYMKAIFSSKKINNYKVTDDDLKFSKSFYKDCISIIKKANSERKKIYEKKSISWKLRTLMASCLFIVIAIIFFAFFNFNFYEIKQYTMPMIYLIIFISVFLFSKERNIILLIWLLIFIGIPFFILFDGFNRVDQNNIPIVYIGIISGIICLICLYHLRKLNKKTLIILGNLLGFKKFIEVAEKPRLELLIDKDPQYFYNILPYAYLFGISDKWIKNFKNIIPLNPSWYQGSEFNNKSFIRFSNVMKTLSAPSVSNGGISSKSGGRGGFVGGGGGGGGGGSW